MELTDFGDRLRLADELFDLLEDAIRILKAGPGDGREARLRRVLAKLREHLKHVEQDIGLDTGPLIEVPESAFPFPAFRDFVAGCNRAARALVQLQQDRQRWGDVSWAGHESDCRAFHSAACDLSGFRALAESHLTGDQVGRVQTRLQFDRDARLDAEDAHRNGLIEEALDRLSDREQERKWREIEAWLDGGRGSAGRQSNGSNGEPTAMELDTYRVYSAVESYLMAAGDVSKVRQTDIHQAAKTLLGSEIDREEIGVDPDYKVQPKFDAFGRAYRRARDYLSAG